MISKELLTMVCPRPSDTGGLVYSGGTERAGMILAGEARSPATGETYQIKDGYLDLLKSRTGADSLANLTNFLPGAGRGYEPLWRVHSLSLSTNLGSGVAVGIDISPSMLREAARRARAIGANPSFVRANAKHLPFLDASFTGAVCGGTLNEVGDPARVLRETYRVLEPGGRLATMGIMRAGTPRGRRLQRILSTGGITFFDPDELESLLDHAGFEPDPPQTYSPVFFSGSTRRG